MASLSGDHDLLKLKSPESFEEDSSVLCVKELSKDKVIIGTERGVFITSLDPSIHFIETLKQYDLKEVPSICTEFDNNDIFYVSSEKIINKFDFRCPLDKVICCFNENSDEINQITINNNGLLAACDDSGECKIYDTKKNTLYRTLRNRHKNICSTAAFLPTRQDDIVTGGLDSQILLWNYKTAKLNQTINTQDLLNKLGDDSVKMFNPPMVNSLSSSNDGKLLAAGLGNGSLQVFHILKGKTAIAPSLLINRHSTLGVTSIEVIETGNTDSYLLASAGNDAEINIWRAPFVETVNKKKQTRPDNKVVLEEDDIAFYNMKRFKLESKVNTLFTCETLSNKTILLIGDQTSTVKYYDITSMCLQESEE